jgi:uncharacterized protein YbcC (UPF0753/DUF2309 family)
VNPYWGFVDQPIAEAAAQFGALSGSRLTMSRNWFRAQQALGAFSDTHLNRAAAMLGDAATAPEALSAAKAALTSADADVPVCRLMPDLVDDTREVAHHALWSDFVVQNVSWACGSYYSDGQASWTADRSNGLYALWRELAVHDPGPRLLMGLKGFTDAVKALPETPHALIAEAVALLEISPARQATYFTALLMDVPGWAAACGFARWEARLGGGDDHQIEELLAVRLAWEVLLYRVSGAPQLTARWLETRQGWDHLPEVIQTQQLGDWTVQRALELGYQERLAAALAKAPALSAPVVADAGTAAATTGASATPSAQAVFCIDVRSEVIRRALETAAPDVHTLGFAGFFGLPIAYEPAGGAARPQLPGLLSPAVQVRDTGSGAEAHAARVQQQAGFTSQWKKFLTTAGSGFTAVEAMGMGYAFSLVRDGLATRDAELDPLRGDLATGGGTVAPRFPTRESDPEALDLEARVATATAVLRGMSLTHGFAPIVAFIGHGATVTNNPQAAGLACGACGGQSGEVNARVLAALLNEPAVRAGLVGQGITVPDTTHFVPGLHNTVTDEITLFDLDEAPASHREPLQAFSKSLADAGAGARAERAPLLGLSTKRGDRATLHEAMKRRAADWSEVRPEWGLARNAAFIVAPRSRTRGVKLDGRSFLHEYRWEEDTGFAVLTGILTAPMVVTNWINMQYNASTVDPERFGSGDKVLHNVAGGNLGVYEGAGGDLRIGLALQSVHDGNDWVHEPLRLSVLVEAPALAIDDIIAKHAVVEQLALNGWLHLIRIDSETGQLFQRGREKWFPLVEEA